MKDSESSTSVVFAAAIEEVLGHGEKLTIFAPSYIDNLPEAKAMGIGFTSTKMFYRARSKVSGIWIMYVEGISQTEIPGFPQHSGPNYQEMLRLTSQMPEFRALISDPEQVPILQSGSLIAEVIVSFNQERRLKGVESRLLMGNVLVEPYLAILALKMLELTSRDAKKILDKP